jgi:eukaryotic-like serine/threonine-protein kinase
MNDLATAYLDGQQWSKAETVARDCLSLRAKKQPDDWLSFHTMSQLGAALAGQKKYAEAEPLLVEGYEGMKKREAQIPPEGRPRLAEAAERLVQLYEATGRDELAAQWRKRRDEAKKEPIPPGK